MVTCRYCKEKLSRDEAAKVGKTSYYHPDCLEQKENEENQNKVESNHYKELIDYICKLYKLDAPTGMILKQIKEYKDNYGYKYQGMRLALEYFYEIENKKVLEDSGIGIIPYVYEKAKNHYIMKMNVEQSIEEYSNEIEEVTIDLNSKPKRKANLIDISAL